ncbi:PQQ-binding-like beta-propeller repeat protein [Saccharicrinis aurantiacus]|uniref:outer membrane protein assembly factor BamB family protein n=1 Tax=Saccharicrinis aurantiacus TaxID=1849719 RepID=UPI002493B5E2|nr:PQQ-binding-like beta-propeller repeat protein [Saccharicrinis aurantiacus]
MMKIKYIILGVILCLLPCAVKGQSVSQLDSLKSDVKQKLALFRQLKADSVGKDTELYREVYNNFSEAYDNYTEVETIVKNRIWMEKRDSTYSQSPRFLGTIISRKYLRYSSIVIDDNILFLYANHLLWSINTDTREILWKSDCNYSKRQESIIQSDSLIILPFIYDNIINAHSKVNGTLVWSIDSAQYIMTADSSYSNLPFINRSNQLYEINDRSGELIKCNEPIPTRIFNHKEYEIVMHQHNAVDGKGNIYTNWTITCTNKITGKLQWQKSNIGKPFSRYHSMYITDNLLWLDDGNENLSVINIKNGKTKQSQIKCGYFYPTNNGFLEQLPDDNIRYTNLRYPRRSWSYLFPKGEGVIRPSGRIPIYLNENTVYVITEKNIITAFNSKTGDIEWEFPSYSKITSNLVVENDILYFTDAEGLVAIDVSKKNDKKKWEPAMLSFPEEKEEEEKEEPKPVLISTSYRTTIGEEWDEKDIIGDFVLYIKTKDAIGEKLAIKFTMPGRVVMYNGEIVKDNNLTGYTIKSDFDKVYFTAKILEETND